MMDRPSRPMRTHTNLEFEAELQSLKDLLLVMGGRCEEMIATAVRAFEERDSDLAEQVMQTDQEMNQDEVAVDDLAVRILALRQPVGRDLRFAVAAVKAVTDLERIGDEAVNIAERAMEMTPRTGSACRAPSSRRWPAAPGRCYGMLSTHSSTKTRKRLETCSRKMTPSMTCTQRSSRRAWTT